jgi:6-phosphofructokinase
MKRRGKKKGTIAILTGGGDVPGLNPCIKTLVYRGHSEGISVIGIRRGWAGLLDYNPDYPASAKQCFKKLEPAEVRTIDRSGGTYLHTSRTNPSAVKNKHVPSFLKNTRQKNEEVHDFTNHVLRNLERLNIDAIIPIGGDDTLSFGERLHMEGFPVIAIPKTMDNDVFGTDYSNSIGRFYPCPQDLHRFSRKDRRNRAVWPLLWRDLFNIRLPGGSGSSDHIGSPL